MKKITDKKTIVMTEEGICHGLSHIGTLMILANKRDADGTHLGLVKLQKIIARMKSMALEIYPQRIEELSQARIALFTSVKEAVSQLSVQEINQFDSSNSSLELKRHHLITKLVEEKMQTDFTEEELIDLDTINFTDGVEILQDMDLHPELQKEHERSEVFQPVIALSLLVDKLKQVPAYQHLFQLNVMKEKVLKKNVKLMLSLAYNCGDIELVNSLYQKGYIDIITHAIVQCDVYIQARCREEDLNYYESNISHPNNIDDTTMYYRWRCEIALQIQNLTKHSRLSFFNSKQNKAEIEFWMTVLQTETYNPNKLVAINELILNLYAQWVYEGKNTEGLFKEGKEPSKLFPSHVIYLGIKLSMKELLNTFKKIHAYDAELSKKVMDEIKQLTGKIEDKCQEKRNCLTAALKQAGGIAMQLALKSDISHGPLEQAFATLNESEVVESPIQIKK